MPASIHIAHSDSPGNAAKAGLRSRSLPRKTRIVRPRGRAKNHVESEDEEIVRELATDSESDDAQSSLDSASESDIQPASEEIVHNGHTRVITPGISQSLEQSPLLHSEMSAAVVGGINGEDTSMFKSAATWSEMVAEEATDSPADLPVIDFTEFDGNLIREPSPMVSHTRLTRKVSKRSSSAQASPGSSSPASVPPVTADQVDSLDKQRPRFRKPAQIHKRPPGQSARQVYQQRLESDPSYVPTVGEFWGHDDRLMDKNLRSLSEWWRVRWQGRGRGGGGPPISSRGRGSHPGNRIPQTNGSRSSPEEVFDDSSLALPPIEQQWGHDGFEEMKRKEERRRLNPDQSRRGSPRGRGGHFAIRSRNGLASGTYSTPNTGRTSHFSTTSDTDRPWFAMKPERVWTKQHDAFLHLDPALKIRDGHSLGFRVKLPGGQIITAPAISSPTTHQIAPKLSIPSATDSDGGEKTFVVRLPRRLDKDHTIHDISDESTHGETITTAANPPMEDVFTVRPELQEQKSFIPPQSPSTTEPPAEPTSQPTPVEPWVPERNEQAAEKVGGNEGTEASVILPQADPPKPDPTNLTPIQTSFSPVQHPSASYPSPYAYAPSLPPGIVMGQNGVPYELATGRAVYLQPPPVFNPRQLLHTPIPMSYAANHMRHHSTMTPEYLGTAHVAQHTPPLSTFIDPSTGAALFSLPPQSSRIEIRPPSDADEKSRSNSGDRRSSGSKRGSNHPGVAQATIATGGHEYFSPVAVDSGSLHVPYPSGIRSASETGPISQHQQSLDHAAMAYPSYHQHYYYPEPYGYPHYMDMSQVQGYEMYPSDLRASQPVGYY
jgi:hypothetical protein